MIYLDSSVALAHLLSETRRPSPDLWRQPLASSRLLEYEIWNRLHARGLDQSRQQEALGLLSRIALIELSPLALARALDPFPIPLRTLDGLHLASADFIRNLGQAVELASYDERLKAGAVALGIPLCTL